MPFKITGIHRPGHKATLLFLDLLALATSFSFVAQIRLGTQPDLYGYEYCAINLIIMFNLFIGGAYSSNSYTSQPRLPLRVFFVALASSAPCFLFIYSLGPESFTSIFGRGVFPFAIILFSSLAAAARYLVNKPIFNRDAAKLVAFLGDYESHARLINAVDTSEYDFRVKHYTRLSDFSNSKHMPNTFVLCPDYKPTKRDLELLLKYRLSGRPIYSLSDFCENFLFFIPIHEINDKWFIKSEGFSMLHNATASRLKRALDILAAILLIVLTLPITLTTAALIKLTSRGPVFFSQVRVGAHGKTFTLLKFRTMRQDAETEGARWATEDDPRIIPVGKFLRTTRIDELPQCINILRGHMSLIGPRPERPEFTKKLENSIPYYDLRHIIKPGLTGWAQVNYPYGASTEDSLRKLQFDLYYIKNHSLILDLNIVLRTILVTTRRGGR